MAVPHGCPAAVTPGPYRWPLMRIMVSGLPAAILDRVHAEVREALALHPDCGNLVVVVNRLPAAGWLTHVFDGQTGAEITDLRALARRLAAISNVSH